MFYILRPYATACVLSPFTMSAHPWFMGRCTPVPICRPALARSSSVRKVLAARTASRGAAPFASSAAMAAARVHPVPCVLPVLRPHQLN